MPRRTIYLKTPFLPSQRNHIFKLIEGQGLNPAEFRWTTRDSDYGVHLVDALIHVPSGYHFIFDVDSDEVRRWARFSPGQRQLEEEAEIRFPVGLDDYFGYIGSIWLPQLSRELVQPDLWAEIGQGGLLPTSESKDNAPFDVDEQEYIVRKLGSVEKQLIDLSGHTEEQAKVIQDAIDEIRSALKRLGRSDWIFFVTGQLFNLATALAMDGAKARAMFDLVRRVLAEVPRLLQ